MYFLLKNDRHASGEIDGNRAARIIKMMHIHPVIWRRHGFGAFGEQASDQRALAQTIFTDGEHMIAAGANVQRGIDGFDGAHLTKANLRLRQAAATGFGQGGRVCVALKIGGLQTMGGF